MGCAQKKLKLVSVVSSEETRQMIWSEMFKIINDLNELKQNVGDKNKKLNSILQNLSEKDKENLNNLPYDN